MDRFCRPSGSDKGDFSSKSPESNGGCDSIKGCDTKLFLGTGGTPKAVAQDPLGDISQVGRDE